MARAALLAVAAALLLRLAFVGWHERPLVSDEIDYDRLGWTLATTGTYSDEGHPTAYRPIGYPAVVAGIYAIAGRRPWAIHLAQAALGAASVLLMFLIGGGGKAGLLAAWLWAVYPPALIYTDLLMPEATFTALLIGAVYLAERGALGKRSSALLLGAAIGFLALVKAMALLLLPTLPLAARMERVRPVHVAVLVLGGLLVVGPWVVRNWRVVGYPTMATSTGANLLIGNHPSATGGYAPDIPPAMISKEQTEAGRSREELRTAIRYAGDNPIRFLKNGLKKEAHLFGSEGGMLVWAFHPSPGDSSTRLREKYRSLPVWLHVAVSGAYAIVILIGTLGAFTYPRGPTRAFFLAVLTATLVTSFVFYGGARYHFPLMPFLALFAANWAVRRHAGPTPWNRGQAVAVVAVWTGLLAVWIGELAKVIRG